MVHGCAVGLGLISIPRSWHRELYVELGLSRYYGLEDLTIEDELEGLAGFELDDIKSLLCRRHTTSGLLHDDLDLREHRLRSICDAPCDQDFLR